MKYHIEIHGCQMNISDAERIATICERNGYINTENWRETDLIIYVSCSIKQKAEDKILGHMRELSMMKKKNKNLMVGITGCMVHKTSTQRDEEKDAILKKNSTIDFVFRMEDLDQLEYILRKKTPQDIGRTFGDPQYFNIEAKLSVSYRGYLPIMSGCDNFCTFCIVPYSRGRERSRLMSDIISDAKNMSQQGVKELLLLGQNVNSYGNKNEVYDEQFADDKVNHPFTRLLIELNKIDNIKRIRFTSPNPKDMTEELIMKIAELDNVCEHIHLPLQSGDDEMLKRMNRHYTAEHFLNIVKMIRKHIPRAGISTDIIVGFSGETEEQFLETMRVAEEAKFDLSYTSMYCERKPTYASRFLDDNIPKKIKNKRYHTLNNLIKKTSYESNKNYINEVWEVLVDSIDEKIAMGKTRTNRTIRFLKKENIELGNLVNVNVDKALEWVMIGTIV